MKVLKVINNNIRRSKKNYVNGDKE